MQDITIFIVEDDTSVRRALTRLLRVDGFPVRAFASAEEFLDEPVPPVGRNLLICDVWLEAMTGPELVNELRRTGRDLPIIFITGRDAQDVRKRFPAETVIDKPVQPETLLRAIKMLLAL